MTATSLGATGVSAGTTAPLESLVADRRDRLNDVLVANDIPALLTSDPFSIRYITGTRNMLVHNLTGPDRLVLAFANGPTVLWEFAGCEHLWADHDGVDEIRPAPGLNAKKTPNFRTEAARFAAEISSLCREQLGDDHRLAVEALDAPVTDALRSVGAIIGDATGPMQQAMAIKQPSELEAMRQAITVTQAATAELHAAIEPGRTEQEVWSEFHRSFIAAGGEFVVTRLLQSGLRTFPYFQEASDNQLRSGDLVCFDTDAVALHGYSVDFSRTFLCGDEAPTARQKSLHHLAVEQLSHNAANLKPGRSYEAFADLAFEVPEPHREHGYYQLAHGLGLAGGHPNIPRSTNGPYPLPGEFEPGMVICIESYVGDPDTRQGVKVEDQYLITDTGAEAMTTYPFDARLGSAV